MKQSLLFLGLVLSLAAARTTSQNMTPRAACSGNTASTRGQWCDYSIDTNYETEVVSTGNTKEYWLELTDVTVAPDGVSRTAMAINGTIPGPTLYADWGDDVVVHVSNSLTTSLNGTSIHFHGIRQNYTNQYDGVSSITQCPIGAGETITYKWKATQHGSTWYHSHWALQAWQGIFGGIVINGPATANYDEDLGLVILSDWDHQTVDELYTSAETAGAPTLDNALINGTNVFGDDGSAEQTGKRFNVSFTSGTSYRMRLVNTAIDTHFKFSIDNHTMTVIAADLVPVVPYNTEVVELGIAQRIDVIVVANQASVADNFWLRAIPQSACSDVTNPTNIKGVVYYGDSPGTPTTTGFDYLDSCEDETPSLVPHISKSIEAASETDLETVTVGFNSAGLFKWYLNSTTMLVNWANPTLMQVLDEVSEFTATEAVFTLDEANRWVYFIVQTTLGVPHPIHLHGHDFSILAQGTGVYNSSVVLNTTNPPRRDTAMLPASGYMVMAWETDNPGVWLMHCHIGWHTSEGFAVQFVERASEISGITNSSYVKDTCSAWSSYQTTKNIMQEDSGV